MSAPDDNADFTWKILLGGHGGVGKTTLLYRYFFDEFKHDTSMTVGCDFTSRTIVRQEKSINLIIWDLGGQKRFDVLHPAYVGDATGAFIFFDMSSIETLDGVTKWVNLIRQYNGPSIPMILVGTKVDLIQDQEMLDTVYSLAENKMRELEIDYISVTSAKTNYNVDETLHFLIDYILWSKSMET
ncbi:GTP-binding protein [Candidatus Bathyarchaeota archaeon]|nr:GTP-binding protein [Candidatus Bathyarchaeota archaeon]